MAATPDLTLRFGEASLQVVSQDPLTLRVLEEKFASRVTLTPTTGSVLKIFVTTTTTPSSHPIEKHWNLVRARPLYGEYKNGLLNFTDGESFCTLNYSDRTAHLNVTPGTLEDFYFYSRTFLLLPILELLRLENWFYVHGSIIHIHGRNTLCLAPGGTGKSSLSIEALHRGASVLCDDNFLMTIQEGKVVAIPFEEEFCVQKSPRIKIPRATFSLLQIPLQMEIDDVIYLARSSQKQELETWSRAEIFSALMEENPFGLLNPGLSHSHIQSMQVLVEKWRGCILLPDLVPFDRAKLWEIFTDSVRHL